MSSEIDKYLFRVADKAGEEAQLLGMHGLATDADLLVANIDPVAAGGQGHDVGGQLPVFALA